MEETNPGGELIPHNPDGYGPQCPNNLRGLLDTYTTRNQNGCIQFNILPTMASVTIKDIPDEILEALRHRAAADHRSLNKEVIHLLGTALSSSFAPGDSVHRKQVADRQADAWTRLTGRWDSDQRVEDEIADIYSARSEGRDIDL